MANVQLGFIRVGGTYEQSGYRGVYATHDWSAYANLPLSFFAKGMYLGVSYSSHQEFFNSKDLRRR